MNKFNWRRLTSDDYPLLVKWWKDWDWPTPPTIEMLPANAVLVYNEETGLPLYAGFLYETGTILGWVEFIVSNKDAAPSEKRGGLEYLIEVIGVIAKDRGITKLFTSTQIPSFVQSLKKAGFWVGDTGMTQLIKPL